MPSSKKDTSRERELRQKNMDAAEHMFKSRIADCWGLEREIAEKKAELAARKADAGKYLRMYRKYAGLPATVINGLLGITRGITTQREQGRASTHTLSRAFASYKKAADHLKNFKP